MPPAIAASMKGCARSDSTTLRTRRTMRGISGITIAAMTTARPGRVSVISAIASRIDGIAMIPSMIRITIASTHL